MMKIVSRFKSNISRSPGYAALRAIFLISAVSALSACAPVIPIPTLDSFKYDAEVDRRCKIDGGLHVYETVKVPKEKLDKKRVSN